MSTHGDVIWVVNIIMPQHALFGTSNGLLTSVIYFSYTNIFNILSGKMSETAEPAKFYYWNRGGGLPL